jgi:uncharacterized membrane protein
MPRSKKRRGEKTTMLELKNLPVFIIACFLWLVYPYMTTIMTYLELWSWMIGQAITISIPLLITVAWFFVFAQAWRWYHDQKNRWANEAAPWQVKMVEAQKKTVSAPLLSASNTPKNRLISIEKNGPEIAKGEAWLREFCQPKNNAHFAVFGGTRVGKTSLLHYLVWAIQQPEPSAEYYILDPHNEPQKWFTPVVASKVSEAESFGEFMAQKAEKKQGNRAIFIADELGKYKHTDFNKYAIRAMEEGAKHRVSVVLSGHGITKSANGFSPDNLNNCGILAFENLGFSLLNHASFPMRHDRELKQILQEQLKELSAKNQGLTLEDPNKIRFGIAKPSNGLPFVFQVPFIDKSKLVFNQKADINNLFLLPKTDDLSVVKSRFGEVKYHADGRINLASISAILEAPSGGSGYTRAKNVEKLLLNDDSVFGASRSDFCSSLK